MNKRADDRRSFLKGAIALAGMAMAGPAWTAARSRTKLGLQLYTVLDLLQQDLEGTLKQVAALGYREVETLGVFGMDAKRFRAALDAAGLVSPSQHLMPLGLEKDFAARVHRELTLEELERRFLERFADVEALIGEAADWARTLGQKYLVWQIIWPSQMRSEQTIRAFADALDRAGRLAARAGLKLAFHNHGGEFQPVDGIVPYDLIVEETDPHLVDLEMDVCWMISKQRDPIAYLDRFPGRYRLMHLKDVDAQGKSVPVGEGIVPFRAVVAAARKAHVRHMYMELDAPKDPMAVVRDAARYLAPLL